MKYLVLTIQSSREEWLSEAIVAFSSKINRYQALEVKEIGSVKFARLAKDKKLKVESELILKKIECDDLVVLFDQRGKSSTSEKFSSDLERIKSQGARRVIFVVGGAFGVSDEVRKRANVVLSLSSMVMNHHVALVVVLEQIYRSLSIEKNLPYHNP